MGSNSIQIQSVIYGNEKKSLKKAMDALANSIDVCRRNNGELTKFVLYYGDASDISVYDEIEIEEIKKEYENYFEFKYKVFGYNAGSANGQTVLGLESDSDYLLLMNPDVMVSPNFLVEIVKPFGDESVGMTEGRQCPIEHHKDYDSSTGEEDWCTGACSVIRTSLFKELGGYDYKSFFLYCDDVDLSWRVRKEGYKIIYVPAAFVYHAKRLTSDAGWIPTKAEIYYSAEASLMMAYKWNNNDRVVTLCNRFRNGSEVERKVLTEFERKRDNNELPQQIKDNKVASFNGEYYSENRFVI